MTTAATTLDPTLLDVAANALGCSDTGELAESALWQIRNDLLVLRNATGPGSELQSEVVAGCAYGIACRAEAAVELLKQVRMATPSSTGASAPERLLGDIEAGPRPRAGARDDTQQGPGARGRAAGCGGLLPRRGAATRGGIGYHQVPSVGD